LHGNEVDTATGQLTPIGHMSTEAVPSPFSLDPEGRFIFAAGSASGRLPVTDCGPIAQINRITVERENPAFLSRKPTDQRRADHAAMAGDEYTPSGKRKWVDGVILSARTGRAS
jgi:hypothetical protein